MAGDVHIMSKGSLIQVFVVILCLYLAGSALGKSRKPRKPLYSSEDDVVVLTYENFTESVFGSESAWFVGFFSSWCGHCRRFAPTWKKLATETKGWSPVIKVGAIDCAREENFNACKTVDIPGYPELKLFNANAIEGVDKGEQYTGDRSMNDLRHTMVEFLERQSAGNRPKSWPKLHKLQSMQDIWKDVHHAIQYTAIVFEDTKSDLGMEVILDMSKHRKLLVRRMLREDVKKFGITTVPSLFLINQDATFKKLADQGDRAEFVHQLKMLIGVKDDVIPTEANTNAEVVVKDLLEGAGAGAGAGSETRVLRYPDGVHMQDLESALHYTFRMEIPRMTSIQGPALQALKDLIRNLAKYWPGSIVIHQHLNKLSDWLQRQEGPISGDVWLKTVSDMQTSQAYIPTTLRWTECAGSAEGYRGYPCSMWTLFHTLTVNAALQQDQQKDERFDPLDIPRTMRGYIIGFFGCRECAQNFQKEAESLEKQISSADSAVLWLWTVHNRVNKRLQSDITTDPDHPKLQFPAAGMCQECWTTDTAGKLIFNEVEVLGYLKRFYSKHSIIEDVEPYKFSPRSVQSTTRPSTPHRRNTERPTTTLDLKRRKGYYRSTPKDKLDEKPKPAFDEERVARLRQQEVETRLLSAQLRAASSGLNRIDLSLCLAFYLMCTAIIILIYYHFTVNRRMQLGFKLLSKA